MMTMNQSSYIIIFVIIKRQRHALDFCHLPCELRSAYARRMARLKLDNGSRRRTPPAMERVRKARMGKGAERKRRASGVPERPAQEAVFLPSHEHLVKMVALQGADDEEIARMFGVPYEHFRAWRKLYPSFNEALNEGRLAIDAEVTYALYKNATGFEYEEETATPKGGVVRVKKYARPSGSDARYWLENRRPDLWRTASTTRVTGKDDDTPVGVKLETRNELIDSIVALISPKADGKMRPDKPENDRVKR